MIQLIETTLTREGDGKSADSPIRIITEYWSTDGDRVISHDPAAVKVTPEMRAAMRNVLFSAYASAPVAKEIWTAMLKIMQPAQFAEYTTTTPRTGEREC